MTDTLSIVATLFAILARNQSIQLGIILMKRVLPGYVKVII
jgi:hypothetical protein